MDYIQSIAMLTERERALILRCILEYQDYETTCRFMQDEGMATPSIDTYRNFRNMPDVKESLRSVWEDVGRNKEFSPVFQMSTLAKMSQASRTNHDLASKLLDRSGDSTNYLKQYLTVIEATKQLRIATDMLYASSADNIESRQLQQQEQMQRTLLTNLAKELDMRIEGDAIILDDGTVIPLDITKLLGVAPVEST